MTNNHTFEKIATYLMALAVMIFTIAPFLWILITSISTNKQITGSPFSWFPKEPTLQNYAKVFTDQTNISGYVDSLLNSLIVASVTTFVCLLFGALGAYAFARLQFKFREYFILFILFTQMIPGIAVLIPIYIIFKNIGMLDTKSSLIMTQISFILPFIIWVMRSFFYTVPKELEDAAFIDGLGRFGALFRIILPISTPGLFATGVFAFLNSWNDFLTPLVLTSTTQAKTMPVAINEFLGRFSVDYGLLTAAGVVGLLPPILISLLFQRFLIDGLTAGAVKS
ncbi:carbohydrate ABC transporter permease [Gordoniibacillus kamchatkensis]|uniref:carbohydrate ABC transporter permease n=1 Tax=Gordoniibacillus kamchatkensis TaxID=1590651 RepID=UPI0006991C14|nr:carbohydrate ABC transporter permease [Paenibacillus sp. VKM B-2647]